MWQDLSNALRDLWQASEPSGASYRADLHYTRGPGPKWHAKHSGFRSVAQASAKNAITTRQHAPKPRRCPTCAQSMRVIRSTERFGDLPVLHTYACSACDVVLAHEAEPVFA
ncbi:MAG: hypothetical protein ABSE22_08355 [Xanthobacteraceae bacterium]|jgi:hypothetical protein